LYIQYYINEEFWLFPNIEPNIVPPPILPFLIYIIATRTLTSSNKPGQENRTMIGLVLLLI